MWFNHAFNQAIKRRIGFGKTNESGVRQEDSEMKSRIKTAFLGVAAMAGLLTAESAQADHVSVGLGLSTGYGDYLSLGFNNRGRCGGYYGGFYRPGPVVYAPAPVVYAQPAPVVYAQPAPVVYAQPAPVVYAQPAPVVVQSGGYWADVDSQVWCDGVWIDFIDEWGHHGRRRGPGHWETHHGREWRGGGGDHGGPRGGGFGGGDHGGPGGHR